jgi:hypothetical protein
MVWWGYGTLALCEFSFFVGVVLCSIFIERIPIKRPGIAYICSLAVIGLTVVLMSLSRNPWAFSFWNVVAGLALPFAHVPMTVYIQRIVPQEFQGRVNSTFTMTQMGIQPLSIGLGGLLLAAIGPAWMLVVMGVGMSVASLLGLFSPTFRRVGSDEVPPTSEGSLPTAAVPER